MRWANNNGTKNVYNLFLLTQVQFSLKKLCHQRVAGKTIKFVIFWWPCVLVSLKSCLLAKNSQGHYFLWVWANARFYELIPVNRYSLPSIGSMFIVHCSSIKIMSWLILDLFEPFVWNSLQINLFFLAFLNGARVRAKKLATTFVYCSIKMHNLC